MNCLYAWPNTTTALSGSAEIREDHVVFSKNVSLESLGETVIFVGSFSSSGLSLFFYILVFTFVILNGGAESRKLYSELSPAENKNDDSFGLVESNFIFALKNQVI